MAQVNFMITAYEFISRNDKHVAFLSRLSKKKNH